jgi:hypothetical protein
MWLHTVHLLNKKKNIKKYVCTAQVEKIKAKRVADSLYCKALLHSRCGRVPTVVPEKVVAKCLDKTGQFHQSRYLIRTFA